MFSKVKDIGYEIRTINNLIEKMRRNNNAELVGDLTPMQCWTIGYLYVNQNMDIYQKDIEARFDISRATTTNMLKIMERKGLIVRKSVKSDARLKKIILTGKSVKLHTNAMKELEKVEKTITNNMTPEEVENLLRLLEIVKKNIEKMSMEGEKNVKDIS